MPDVVASPLTGASPEACCGGAGAHAPAAQATGAGSRPAAVVHSRGDAALEAIAATVNDPEIPVLSIKDLGILRGVRQEAGEVVVTITPTYSGCPAMDTIADDLRIAFQDAGYPGARIELTLSPAWTTDWMSEEGKAKLAQYGIAPPTPRREGDRLRLAMAVKCPRCHSLDTRELSRFGSTSCKALYQCNACLEPFDFFKAL
jgi:ring-1,2-phenylacetyl-CoA epoxidase subunit PaaD